MDCTPWCAIGGIYSGTVTIPSTVIYNGVEYVVNRIAPAAFVHCTDLIEVKMPSTIETIGIGAFYDCPKLKTIDFSPNTRGVRSIDFYGCNSLEKLDLSRISDFVSLRLDYLPNVKEIILPPNAVLYSVTDLSSDKIDRNFYISNPIPPYVFGEFTGLSEGSTLYSPSPTGYSYTKLWGDGIRNHKDIASAGIEEVVAAKMPPYTVNGNAITAPADCSLEVYDTKGCLMAIIPAGSTTTFLAGVYVIKSGFSSEKIAIQ